MYYFLKMQYFFIKKIITYLTFFILKYNFEISMKKKYLLKSFFFIYLIIFKLNEKSLKFHFNFF